MVRTWPFHRQGPRSIPDQRTKIPQASRHGKKKKRMYKDAHYLIFDKGVMKKIILHLQYIKKYCLNTLTWKDVCSLSEKKGNLHYSV